MSWKSLIDRALGTDFDTPAYDPTVGRKKLIRQIDVAAKQHKDGTTRAPNRAWKAGGKQSNPAIRFAAKVNGRPVPLDGDEEVYVPASRFQDFLQHLKKSVEAGELDAEIKAALEGEGEPDVNKLGIARKATAGGTRNVSEQSALNIGVAAKRRAANPPSFDDIRKGYVDAGRDATLVDAAIAKRKAAEAE